MQARFIHTVAVAVALGGFMSMPVYGYDDREGLNFGTSLRLISADDRTSAAPGSDRTTHTKTAGQQVTPYIGFAFSSMNIGLALNMESTTSETVEASESTSEEFRRSITTDARGLSAFFRFNFGRVMFMEAGAGLYSKESKIRNQSTSNLGDGSFNGQREEYDVKGTGPGYHMGGGIELAITEGFHFTTAYLVRVFQLRDVTQGGQIGTKKGFEQKRELTFGVSHYIN